MVPAIHATFHNQPFIMRRAIWRHVFGHTDSHTHTLTHSHTHSHTHTSKPSTAGVQLVGHISKNYVCHTSNIIFITDVHRCMSAILTNLVLFTMFTGMALHSLDTFTVFAAVATRSRADFSSMEDRRCKSLITFNVF